MIVVKLQGGLGNQMFQYAFGLSLSQKHNSQLYLDTSSLGQSGQDYALRNYELDIFNIKPKIADAKLLNRLLKPDLLQRAINKIRVGKAKVYREKNLQYDEGVFQAPPPAYFDGFWQSEKYFDAALVKQAFTFKGFFNSATQQITDHILRQANPVSIHIRRGDYISSKTTNELHGVCSLRYYRDAIALINDRVSDPYFYLFSDDAEWVEQNLLPTVERATIVRHNQAADSWQDMALMSKCSHHIIANSSFSWWGAWLNNSNEKMVIAPENWFAKKTEYFDDTDILPKEWIKLPND